MRYWTTRILGMLVGGVVIGYVAIYHPIMQNLEICGTVKICPASGYKNSNLGNGQ